MEIIKNKIGDIVPGKWIPFWSDGDFSTHDLLEHVIAYTGKADIYLTAFSISEDAIRRLLLIKEDGLINNITCLFNNQMIRFKTVLYWFISNITTNIRFAPCHAKVIIITGKFSVMIITSGNLTKNRRLESGVICSVDKSVAKMLNEFMNTYNNADHYDI
jgi:hypothetical protein